MLCKNEGCDREAFKSDRSHNYHFSGLCRSCYAQSQIDRLEVRPCEGGCGKRLHNIPYLVLEGIPMGRGPGYRWCYTCMKNGLLEPRKMKTGHCADCEKPMVFSKKHVEGYVRHAALGLCTKCHRISRRVSVNGLYPNKGKHLRKLNEKQVAEIMYLINVKKMTNRELGRQFMVDEDTIGKIRRGKSWKHVKPASHAEIQ
jgi:hypothetical protein